MDNQSIINIAFSIISFGAGWALKILFSYLSKLNEKITSLALTIPEKYVNKNDFENLVKVVHHRFDRIEEKIDELKK